MISFIHTADVHFGVENYGKIDQKTGIHTRLLDFKNALEQAVNYALEHDVDFFLLCGDAYKTAYPTPTQQKLLCGLLFKLQQAGIPVAIVIGNHDHPLSFGKANALDIFDYLPLDNFYVFAKPHTQVIQTKRGPIQLTGIPWPTRNSLVAREDHRLKNNSEIAMYLSEKVGLIIRQLAQELDPKIPAVLAGHLTVSSGIFSGSEKCAIFGTDPIFLPSQLAIEPFDYVALGHLHRYQNLNKKGYPAVVYSGSIERVDFGERKEEKGFCYVKITTDKQGKKDCSHDFIQIDSRPMIQVDVILEPGINQTQQITAALLKHDLDGAIIKITYKLPKGAPDKVDILTIQRVCKDAQYLVGIIPIHVIETKQARTQLKIEMDVRTMLNKYFDSKEELVEQKDVLMKKALELYNEIEGQ